MTLTIKPTSSTSLFKKILALGAAAMLASACGGDPNDMSSDMPGEEGEVAADVGGEEQLESDEAAIFGSDACKNTDIKVINSFELSGSARKIRVFSVEFYSSSEGRWISEDLSNQEISSGSSNWWYDEDLQYLENDRITQMKVHFDYLEFDGDWSADLTQTINITDVTCLADTNFTVTVN